MIRQKTVQIPSADGKVTLHLTVMLPEGKPKAVVQLTHGMMEHRGRYLPLMEFLAEHGYASVIHDHRGHGDSVLDKGDLGYLYDDTAKEIVRDLYTVTKFCKAQFPSLPLYFIAHSMGTLVTRDYMKTHDDAFTKLVLISPPSSQNGTRLLLAVIENLAKILGKRYRAYWSNPVIYGIYNKKIPNAHRWNQWMCSNEDALNRFDADPKCGYTFTLNGYANLMRLNLACYSPKGWQMKNADLPMLILGGGDDPLLSGIRSFHRQIVFLRKRGYTNIKGKIYSGKRHELIHEDIRNTVFDDILRFLQK